MKLIEWFWRLLPDKCQMPDCCRKGVRGNENIIGIADGRQIVVCDDCHAKLVRGTELLWDQGP